MNSPDQFIGGAFAWFTGVVEDIYDPEQMGRVRVRCIGYHTEDKTLIPTHTLPWAQVMMPVTSAGMTGIGRSATGVLQGSWVVGFFRDGPSAQDPIVLGTIASMSSAGDKQKGFSDPSGTYPLTDRLGFPDTPSQATWFYKLATSYVNRKDESVEDVETAIPPKVSTVAVDEPDSYYTRKTWSNLNVDDVVAPIYPKNHVTETESGHVFEVDDTPNFERISEMHTSGTYREIDATGNLTTTIVGDRYTVVAKSDNIYIRGTCNITVDGDVRHLVKGNYHLEVEGNKTEYIKGSRQSKIGQSDQTEIGKDLAENISGNCITRVGLDTTIVRDGNKLENIGKDSSLTVVGNDTHIVLTARKEYTGTNIEVTASGSLALTSAADMVMETTANIVFVTDNNFTTTIGGNRVDSITGNLTRTVSGNASQSVSGNLSQLTTGTMLIRSTGIGTVQSLARLNVNGAPLSLG